MGCSPPKPSEFSVYHERIYERIRMKVRMYKDKDKDIVSL